MAATSNRIPNLSNPLNILNLFTPLKNYKYFEQYESFPFNSKTTSHNLNNAWWLAELSALIYHEEPLVRKYIKQVFGIEDDKITWINGNETDTQGMIVELEDCFIVCFRGTEFYTPQMLTFSRLRSIRKDLITDLKIPRCEDALIPEISVHTGFHNALQDVWHLLTSKLNSSSKPMWFTGHSLGGAVASLAAMRYATRVNGLYTYGMPCLGGEDVVKYCNQNLSGKVFRYKHENDFVVAVMLGFRNGYVHFEKEVILQLEKHNSPFEFIGDVFKLDIIDHSPLFYMLGTRRLI